MLEKFSDYSSITNVYKNQKSNILLKAKKFYEGRREIIIVFEKNMFSLSKPYVFGKNEWEEKYLDRKELTLEI